MRELLRVFAAICFALVGLACTKSQRKRYPLIQKLDGKKLILTIVGVLCLLITVPVDWRKESETKARDQRVLGGQEEMKAMLRQVLTNLPDAQLKVRREQPGQGDEEVEQRTYSVLGKRYGIDPKLLREKLPGFAQELRRAPNATTYDRATAAYVTKDYAEAERLALVAADEAQKATPIQQVGAFNAFRLAGLSADARIEYVDALRHFRDAEKLTDRTRDPLTWASIDWSIAYVLFEHGKYRDAEEEYRAMLKIYEKIVGPEHPDTLSIRNNLAGALEGQGKNAEAEAECRTVLKLRERALGPEHPDTLKSRNNLALALDERGKYAEAEAECRAVLKLDEKVLGPEHPDTLRTCFNLARCLKAENKMDEAKEFARRAADGASRVLAPAHPERQMYERLRQELEAGN